MHKKIIMVFWGNPFFDARCMNMVDEFLDNNNQVSVLGIAKEAQTIKHRDAKIVLMNTKKFNNSITKYFKYFNCVKKFIIKENPDIIIASDLYSMIPISQIKKHHQAEIIYDSREIYTKLASLRNKPIIQKVWSYYEKKYIYLVDCTLANAEIDRDYLLKLYGNLNIKIVKNLPGNNFLNPNSINLKKMLCINEDDDILIYQGKFHEGRGIRFVIQCITKLKNIALVLIGDGPMKIKYLETAKKYKVEDKLFFIDAVPYKQLGQFSVDAYIGLSMIQPISKSYEHALPNKLFEYAVSGLPMICSNLKAMAEMVEQYKHGIAIQYNSELEFHEAYQKILNNYNDYILNIELRNQLLWKKNNNLDDLINE